MRNWNPFRRSGKTESKMFDTMSPLDASPPVMGVSSIPSAEAYLNGAPLICIPPRNPNETETDWERRAVRLSIDYAGWSGKFDENGNRIA